jgi:beta-phosphoglucomutase
MIKAVVFDLDGTLVKTENLKALSYARAAVALKPGLPEEAVINAYKHVVGLSRNEVSEYLWGELHLEEGAQAYTQKHDVDASCRAFAAERLFIYEQMIETPGLLEQYQCPYNVALSDYVRKEGFLVGLATMSHRRQAHRVLDILHLETKFDMIATREDVTSGKPDPDIYLLLARRLGVPPHEILVIEDSVNGLEAALAAEMYTIAVTSTMTTQAVHESGLIAKQWIVDDPALLMTIARQRIAEARLAGVVTRQSLWNR